MNAPALAARAVVRPASAVTLTPRAAVSPSSRTASGSAARAAAPTAAYWCRSRSAALTDQGMSSQSSSIHPVPSSSHSPAAPIPARTASSNCRVVAGGLCSPAGLWPGALCPGLRPGPKNGRPVRVYTAPGIPSAHPEAGPGRVLVTAGEEHGP